MASHNYDQYSGQVYKETIMKVKKLNGVSWEFRCHAETADMNASPPRTGLKSLQELCMHKLVAHSNSLLPETLENLPNAIAIKIWTAIRREWRESYHVWTAFINAGFRERTFKHSLMLKEWSSCPLIDMFSKLHSPRCAWLVDLTLANVTVSAAELKEVSRIGNLQTLHVQYSRGAEGRDLDDRIVKAWSTRAQTESAFAHLKQLSIVNASYITSNVFEHLSGFPVLDVFICGGQYKEGDFKKAAGSGWHKVQVGVSKVKGTAIWNEDHCVWRSEKSTSQLKGLFETQRSRKTGSLSGVPRVDAQLGIFRSGHFDKPVHVLCFQRDQKPATTTPTERSEANARPRKQRKLNDAKGADFAAMLNGG